MSLFSPLKKLFSKEEPTNDVLEPILNLAYAEVQKITRYFYDVETDKFPEAVEQLNQLSNEDKIKAILHCITTIPVDKHSGTYSTMDLEGTHGLKANVKRAIFKFLLRKKLVFSVTAYTELVVQIRKRRDLSWYNTTFFPMSYLLKQLETLLQTNLTSEVKAELINQTEKIVTDFDNYDPKELSKINLKITNLRKENGLLQINDLFFFENKDRFSKSVIKEMLALPMDQQERWANLLELCQKSNGSKPSKKFETDSKAIIQAIGTDVYKQKLYALFNRISEVKEGDLVNNSFYYESKPEETYINNFNSVIVKGLIWTCSQFHDETTLQTIYNLAIRCFKKVPGVGPEAVLLGNACIYSLFKSKGLYGIGLLTRLRLKVKHNSTQATIQKYLAQAAESKGVSLSEIEDIATDSFKLEDGKRTFELGDVKAELRIVGVGKCELIWLKENGTEQKTVPAAVKTQHEDKLKKIKSIQKNIEQTLTAQRDRLDRLFRVDRKMNKEHFQKYFIEHGLLAYLGKRLIWNAQNDNNQESIYWFENKWITRDGKEIDIENCHQFSLWHPALVSTNEALEWRQFFLKNQITQPLKQAFREVYILTPAEINTRIYSNRMAGHILKQHQFVTLAKSRNWNATLEGAWDGGTGNAELPLPEFNLIAQYYTEGLYGEDNYNDIGILLYVSTDQIRFIDTRTGEPMDLIDVPAIVFSEVVRDTDLFVGVASIGNDPNWQDSGERPGMTEYWQSYSFGDLSEIGKNRKELLSTIIPKLKIANQCEITDKFVVVKGKLRTYKIHMGSANILMEPNDQYLCIVQDRSPKTDNKVFIPFEGDQGLSMIISKAFLLAEDDKITDNSILIQINR